MLSLKPKTIDAALGKWPGILVALGVDEKFLRNKHGPCPCCGGVDRYRFDDRSGTGSFFCSNCGAGDGMQLLMRLFGWSFKQAASSVDGVIGNVINQPSKKERSEVDKIAAIKRVLKECKTVKKGDPVWRYLNRRVGIEIVPSDIRFHPSLKHNSGGVHPTMIAIMRDAMGNGVSLHRTYLTSNGFKADVVPVKKFMQGKPLNGSSVWLCEPKDHIGIAEGIETALAASRSFGVDVVAATNAGLMESWIPPLCVRKVSIFADNDSNFVGQAAAYKLASRLARDGISVEVQIPDRIDCDFADDQG